MAAKTKYLVVKTFDSPQGLKRAGDTVSFNNKKDEATHLALGYVELAEVPAPKRRTTEKKKSAKHPGA